ncbi:TonB-dependent receptor [Erythrobacter sp. LQ02-29]|uniref:TonB-dependent receptor n=1 Tax=Erythrobacter sp. LQ02-29 TaxID=2920384 RepID=UPI001F4F0E36|nr:TonB-dependent receptor [Erythrobacter sp. LQ02-29]MCP9222262.1 TonB-dependent receptor [Erythrobacter sp. LQ02-29]
MADRRRAARAARVAALLFASSLPTLAVAQVEQEPEPAANTQAPDDASTIVVIGQRGSAITDIAPIAELDQDALAAIGATSIDDIRQAIQGQTQSASGGEPIFLLNSQRVSGYQEIGSLPPEAIAKVEVLPEEAALRFGYPPTRRVVNFITKRPFSQVEARVAVASTVPFGSATESARAGYTRLSGEARLTANLEYAHTDALDWSERNLALDPDIPFDALGNITGIGGGQIDPALSALAGRIVTIAPVPAAAGDRSQLAAYASAAGDPRLFQPGTLQTLAPGKDTITGEAVLADRVGETLAGSLTLSVAHSRTRALNGPASARLIVPGDNAFSPFNDTVVLNRYLTEVGTLRDRQKTTTVTAGSTLRGAIAGWQWDATASLNQTVTDGTSERGIDLSAANAAIAAGADPFAPLDPGLLAARQTDLTHQRTRTVETKLVVTGSPLELPAGSATATATVEAARLSSLSSLRGESPFDLSLGRSRFEGGLALDLPIAKREMDVLPVIGDLSLNASANLRHVGGFGSLRDRTLGLVWSPIKGLQVNASARRNEAAPDLAQQSTPPRRIEDVPVFDFASGRTEIVTLFTGGNPELLAQRQSVKTLSLNIQPMEKSQLRFNLSYTDSHIRNQTGTIISNSPETEALVPDLFTRDANGTLTAVTYRPINFYSERLETVQVSITANGRLGEPPPPPAEGVPPVADTRPTYYAGLVPTFVLRDDLQLRPGTRALDLVGGDSVGGYKPQFSGYGYLGLNKTGYGGTFSFYYANARRIRSDIPSSDLRFKRLLQLNLTAYVPVSDLVREAGWAKNLQLRLDAQNFTDARQRVGDGNGTVPFRYQANLIDPIGRTVTLSLRKRF